MKTIKTNKTLAQLIDKIVQNTPKRSKPSKLEQVINQECDKGYSDRDIIAEVIHLMTLYRHHNPNS